METHNGVPGMLFGHGRTQGEAGAAPGGERSILWGRVRLWIVLLVPLVLGEVAIYHLDPEIDQRDIVMFLVALPAVLSMILALRIGTYAGTKGLRLHLHLRRDHQPDEIAEAALRTWSYERDRYRRSVTRTEFYAVAFGVITSLLLAGLALIGHFEESPDLALIGVSVATAIVAAFLVAYVGSMVRTSSHDISARAFAWATRSVVLVAAATAGLAVIISPREGEAPLLGLKGALLLGLFTGVTGYHAIDTFLGKANELLGIKKGVERRESPLEAIEGILPEHVARLEEEGLVSVHDFAFAPTPRLFFSLPYGLQAICEWQDEALLLAKLGIDRVRDLFRAFGIRGAVAFRRLAEEELRKLAGGHDGGAAAGHETARQVLVRVLRLESEESLEPFLLAFAADASVERLEAYERAIVLEPAQFDKEAGVPDPEEDRCVVQSPVT